MDTVLLIKAASALAFVLALMGFLSWAVKKAGLVQGLVPPSARRRLRVIEQLPLDHRHRLVIVGCDDKEHLIILGPNGETVVQNDIPVSRNNVVEWAAGKEQKNG